jgi:tRNA dimethylallyltransferase
LQRRDIHATDPQRISRALEVYRVSGRPITAWQREGERTDRLPFRVLKLVLAPLDRAVLHVRIAQRFDQMLQQGLVEEVRGLMADARLHPDLPSMRAVGYRQTWQYLRGELDLDALRAQGVAATRQLAKRQLTWLRGELDLRWFDPDLQRHALERALQDFLAGQSS